MSASCSDPRLPQIPIKKGHFLIRKNTRWMQLETRSTQDSNQGLNSDRDALQKE